MTMKTIALASVLVALVPPPGTFAGTEAAPSDSSDISALLSISIADNGTTVWNDRNYVFHGLSPALQGASLYQGPVRMPSGTVLRLDCGGSGGVFYGLLSQGRGGTFETTLQDDGWTPSIERASWDGDSSGKVHTFDVYAKSGCVTTLPESSGSDVVVAFLHAKTRAQRFLSPVPIHNFRCDWTDDCPRDGYCPAGGSVRFCGYCPSGHGWKPVSSNHPDGYECVTGYERDSPGGCCKQSPPTPAPRPSSTPAPRPSSTPAPTPAPTIPPGDENHLAISLGLGIGGVVGVCVVLSLIMVCQRKRKLLLDDSSSDSSEDDDDEPFFGTSISVPTYWANKQLSEDFNESIVEPSSVEGLIQRLLDSTWKDIRTRDRKGPVPTRLSVVGVQRVENAGMWAKYVRQKASIGNQRGACMPPALLDGNPESGNVLTGVNCVEWSDRLEEGANEFYLFHGTSPEGANAICEDGFSLSMAGRNAGSMFGRGAYFAECSSKADEYSKEGSGPFRGLYSMLMCRVTCGQMLRVLRSDVPAIERAMLSGDYDGVLGDREASVSTYREFVVYKERQIYPEYIITYKRLTEDSSDE